MIEPDLHQDIVAQTAQLSSFLVYDLPVAKVLHPVPSGYFRPLIPRFTVFPKAVAMALTLYMPLIADIPHKIRMGLYIIIPRGATATLEESPSPNPSALRPVIVRAPIDDY